MTWKRKKVECRAELLGYKTTYLHFPAKHAKGTLVCFHGWLDNAASFVPLAESLPDYEFFAWDFLGHGKSAHKHLGDRYHYIDLIPFIDAALFHLGKDNIILTGHSMGAGACSLYAGSVGKHISRLFLIEGFAPLTADATDAPRILSEGVSEFRKAQNLPKPVYDSIDDAIKIRMRVNGLQRETAQPLVERAVMKSGEGITWRADFRLRAPSLLRMTKEQVTAIVGNIQVPALLVLGNQGMSKLHKAATDNRELVKKLQIAKIDGHHHLHMDSASAVAGLFRSFVES